MSSLPHLNDRSRKRTPLLMPVLISTVLFFWSTCNIYFSFENGELPLVDWKTEHKRMFGILWTLSTFFILYPTYLATIFLGVSISRLEYVERRQTNESPWFLAFILSLLVILVTACVRITVTAWFPTSMHLPFQSFNGGPMAGAIAMLVSIGLMTVTLGVIRHISLKQDKGHLNS